MPKEFCKCGRQLIGNSRQRVELCRYCERVAGGRKIEPSAEFVERQPKLEYKDGLTYIIETQPEFDD
jgi:hypothetical protein